jgi:hypothetical protein
MSEPNESHFESEESEALSVANEIAGDDWQVEEGGGDSADLSGPGPRESSPAAPPVPGQSGPTLTLDQARQAWDSATLTRAQLREHANQQYQAAQQAQQERARYEEMANAILRAQQAQQQQPVEGPQIDPELQRYFDGQNQQLRDQLQEMLAPVLNQAQQAQWQQQVQQQVSQEQQQWGEVAQIVGQAEAHYKATPEGQGYDERISGYDGAMRNALRNSGLDDGVANKLVNEQLKGFTMLGMALNVPPPVLIDSYLNSMFDLAFSYYGMQRPGAVPQRNGNGNGYRQQAPQQQRQQQPQRQQARVSPNVAPPSGGAGGTSGIVTAGDLLGRGLNGKDIDALVKEYGSLDKAIRYLDRVGIELEEIGG